MPPMHTRAPLRPLAVLAFAGLCLLAGCAAAPAELIQEGEQALGRGDYQVAAQAFADALEHPKLSQLERPRAALGEVKVFLARKDLVGAEARLRRLADSSSAKWYYLGEVALARGDLPAARRHLRKALDLRHGGDTAVRLARLIGGEARSFQQLAEASAVLKSAGDTAGAEAVGEAAAVWRELLAGGAPGPLLKRLRAVQPSLSAYPTVFLLEALLLDRSGHRGEAAKAWQLEGLEPPPSDAFRAWARELRARVAVERGDSEALEQVLTSADPATANRVRASLAEARLFRGDRTGAMDLWREVAGSKGPGAAPAAALLAEQLELSGQVEAAAELWEQAAAGRTDEPWFALRLARRRTARGDLLGAAASLGSAPLTLLDPSARLQAESLLGAGETLTRALAAHAAGDDARCARLAEAVLQRIPLEPAALALLERRLDEAEEPAGWTEVALRRARLVRHLRAGALEEAVEEIRWCRRRRIEAADAAKQQGPAPRPLDPGPALDELEQVGARELHGALRSGLAAGRRDDARGLLRAADLDLSAPELAPLRGCACLRELDDALPEPRGLQALPERDTPARALPLEVTDTWWGSLTVPQRGLRLPRVGVARGRGQWELHLPGGTLTFKGNAPLEAFLGAALGEVRFRFEHDASGRPPAADVQETYRRGPEGPGPLEVQ